MQQATWQDREWIGQGRVYSTSETLPVVQEGRKSVLQIPQQFKERLPQKDMSVRDLLVLLKDVTQGAVLPMKLGRTLFSAEEANTGLDTLFKTLVLPPKEMINDLCKEFGQMWFDGGAKSIRSWTDPNIRYPLAALTVYREFSRAIEARVEWKRAMVWLEAGKPSKELSALIYQVNDLLHTFEWDTELRALRFHIPTCELFKLLGNSWLSDSQIDMILQVLTERLHYEGNRDSIIAPSILAIVLQGAYTRRNVEGSRTDPFLERYREEFLSGRKKKIYFVGHVNGNHWVAWKLDYEAGTLSRGDSLDMHESAMEPLKTHLLWWMSSLYPGKQDCTYISHGIKCGNQATAHDSTSCGIVACNAIAHELFADKLWDASNSKLLRIEAFKQIVLHHNERRDLPSNNSVLRNIVADDETARTVYPQDAFVLEQATGQTEIGTQDYLGGNNTTPSSLHKTPPQNTVKESYTKSLGSKMSTPGLKKRRELDVAGLVKTDTVSSSKKSKVITGPLDAFVVRKTGTAKDDRARGGQEDEPADYGEGKEMYRKERGHSSDACRSVAVGQSRSARYARNAREARITHTQTISNSRYESFKLNVLLFDPNAQFDPSEWSVWHSKCRRWILMKSLYRHGYFEDHVQRCKVNTTLHDFQTIGQGLSRPSGLWRQTFETRSCSGLTAIHDARIETYLGRLTARGGGGKSRGFIATEKYGVPYCDLSKRQREEVRRVLQTTWTWEIKHEFNAVYSVDCLKTVRIPSSYAEQEKPDHACKPCLALLKLKVFRNAISIPAPPASNTKYTNKEYHQEELGLKLAKVKGLERLFDPKNTETRMAIRYATGVANGDYRTHIVFTGLVDAVVKQQDRKAAGKKMTNFKYSPEFDEFVRTVSLISPRARKLLAEYFPVRSERSIEKLRAKEPQFTAGISECSFERASEFVTALKVPDQLIALSADDTKLMATFRPYHDKETKEWYIVGGTGDPLLVCDPDELEKELERGQMEKATKVRIWVLTIPFPKIPPLVLAALAINDSVSAETLFSYTTMVLNGLHKKEIWPVSYACDGTEKERANQRLLRDRAHGWETRRVKSPSPIAEDLEIKIPLYFGRPMALVQDSLHSRKTYRNNLGSGAKSMVLGNHCSLYKHLREMAFATNSPLYHRDVEKTDKQDDRAAARVFSSAALAWLINSRPDARGTIVYLFVFGELVDAWQNRSLPHTERLHMVLRAYYFMEIWSKFLQAAGYAIRMSCLSREARDITTYLITGFLELFYIYRDHVDGANVPLLPWLHSSEACEHVFAECRKEVKDFDFASFLHLMPKIHWLVRHSMGLGNLSTQDAKKRAGGYIHTWSDTEGLHLSNLLAFPNDDQVLRITKNAHEDAINLWRFLGVFMTDLKRAVGNSRMHPAGSGSDNNDDNNSNSSSDEDDIEEADLDTPSRALPSVEEWYPDLNQARRLIEDVDANGDESCASSIAEASRAILERLIAQDQIVEEKGPMRLSGVEDAMLNITCAKLLLDFDTTIRIDELPIPSKAQYESFLAEYTSAVGDALANSLPPIVDVGQGLIADHEHGSMRASFVQLLSIRRDHETELQRKAIRTATPATSTTAATEESLVTTDVSEREAEDLKARFSLIKRINEVLKLQQDVGLGTGLERKTRWTGNKPTGNAANAAATATATTAKLLANRCRIYSQYRIPRSTSQRLSDAAIRDGHLLTEGTYTIVYIGGKLFVGKVLSIYVRSGGVNGKHSWSACASAIGQPSYISLQTYEPSDRCIFAEVHTSVIHLRVRSFAHIPPYKLLCCLPDQPTVDEGISIELTPRSFTVWSEIEAVSSILPEIMKKFSSKGGGN